MTDEILQCVSSYYKFFKWAWQSISNEKYSDNWHIKYLCDQLQELSEFIIKREPPPYDLLIINIPPGQSKSSIVSQVFPIWLWLQDPSVCTMVSTYSDSLNLRNVRNAKAIIEDEYFIFFNDYIEFKFGKRLELSVNQNNYFNNNYKGEYSGTSIGGTITGLHFNLLVWDDIINPKQAASEAERKHAKLFLDWTLPSRKKDKALTPEIGIMQRLHEDDPTGHELKKAEQGKRIKHICLPGELSDNVKPDECKVFYKNGLLDEKRLSKPILKTMRINLGSYGYAGQISQTPSPDEGGLMKREYWNIVKQNEVPEIIWHMFIDGAYTAKKKNDPTGILIAGICKQKIYVKFVISKWMESPELLRYIPECSLLNGISKASMIYIEPKASGQSLRPQINNLGFNAVDIKSNLIRLDKVARVNEVLPRIESGKVNLIEGFWNDEFIEQCAIFPNGDHDEYPDLISYAIDILLPFNKNIPILFK